MNQDKQRKFKRDTAIKMHINKLISGNYVKDDVNTYIETDLGVSISRARILGTIVRKWMPIAQNEAESDRTPQASITIDDGTETIRVKTWKEDIKMLDDFETGDIVDIIGRVRQYENEIYITPEIIRKIEDPNWELVRELEIIEFMKRIKSNANSQARLIKPQEPGQDKKALFKDKIVELINNYDKGKGVSLNQLKELTEIPEIDFQDVLMELINEGTIYQPNPGKYKIL